MSVCDGETLAGHALSGTSRNPCRYRLERKSMPGSEEVYVAGSGSKASKLHGGLVNRGFESSAGRHSAGDVQRRSGGCLAVQAAD